MFSERDAKRGGEFLDASAEERKAGEQKGTDEEAFKRLAELPAADYDRVRKEEATKLGIRQGTLDKEIAKLRGGDHKEGQGQELSIESPEPWHEAVDGARLLNALAFMFKRHAVLPRHGDKVLALWVLHTYAYDFKDCTPILALLSPQRRCGKTTVLGLVSELAFRALPASNISPAAVFRTITKCKPTLVIDEADSFLKDNEELRGVLNSGHKRNLAYVIRAVGDDHEPRRFSTWAPKALALIGKLSPTLADRAIELTMQRRLPSERIEKLNGFSGETLRRQCARWTQDYERQIAKAEPDMPAILHDRAADNWRPLLTLADLAGGRWPTRARQAAIALSADKEDDSAGIQLLEDIHQTFRDRGVDKLSSNDIVAYLATLEDRPWPEWRNGKPITVRQLATLLKPFRIQPGLKRYGTEVFRGYTRRQFENAFSRYLTMPQSVTPLQVNNGAGSSQCRSVTTENSVTDRDPRRANNHAICNGVTDKKGEIEEWEQSESETADDDPVVPYPPGTMVIYLTRCFSKWVGRLAR